MEAVDPQYTASQILRTIHHDQLYLFLGSAFATIGIVSAAFALLRRKPDPLLLWLALLAILYGGRVWVRTEVIAFELPHAGLWRNFSSALDFLVPIPGFFFFEAAGFLSKFGRTMVHLGSVLYLILALLTVALGHRHELDVISNVVITAATLAVIARSLRRQSATPDFVIIRSGLLVFGGFIVYANVSGALGRFHNAEPFGFAFFLGCLGYVAARQTLHREAQLSEIQKELEVARRMQLSILPGGFPDSRNFRVAARYEPMTSVAGDFYDFLAADDRQAGLLIADVSGHGVPAALIASMVKMAATTQRATENPAELMSGMNAALCGNTQQQFVTAAYVHLDSEAGEFRYAAAGHPPMLLLRNGEVMEIEENGLILAAFSFAAYCNAVRPLERGDRLLLYTDGILEAANAGSEEFGQQRLQALLRKSASLSHTETADTIMSAVRNWAVSQEDDLTVLVCDYGRTA